MTQDTMTHPAVRPFRIDVPEEDLLDLSRRIAETRWAATPASCTKARQVLKRRSS
jgi:hypothetical protein